MLNRERVQAVDDRDEDLFPMDPDFLANGLPDYLNVLVNPQQARIHRNENRCQVGDEQHEQSGADGGLKHPKHAEQVDEWSRHDEDDKGDNLKPLD
jgi:hypothetical protein